MKQWIKTSCIIFFAIHLGFWAGVASCAYLIQHNSFPDIPPVNWQWFITPIFYILALVLWVKIKITA